MGLDQFELAHQWVRPVWRVRKAANRSVFFMRVVGFILLTFDH